MGGPWETSSDTPTTTVIIPTYNEDKIVEATISVIKERSSHSAEIIVADGFSTDKTVSVARSSGAKVLKVRGSRAAQLNEAAKHSQAEYLLFIHADTAVPNGFDLEIQRSLAQHNIVAGAFRLSINSNLFGIKFVAAVANWRSGFLQRPYGDQGLFVKRQQFEEIGGYPDMPFLDDYEMTRRIARRGRIIISRKVVVTSGRRWEALGVVRTTIMNQLIICGYHLGVPVSRLHRWYRGALTRASGGRLHAALR